MSSFCHLSVCDGNGNLMFSLCLSVSSMVLEGIACGQCYFSCFSVSVNVLDHKFLSVTIKFQFLF